MEISVGVEPTDPIERAQYTLANALEFAYRLPGLADAIPGSLTIHLMCNDDVQAITYEWVTKLGVRKQDIFAEQR